MNLAETRQILAEELTRFEPNRPLARAWTPPASWYVDPRFLQLEKASLFRNHWQFIAPRERLREPGEYFCGRFLDVPYVVLLDEKSVLRAFYNVCSHHATCVAEGSGQTRELVCPYHGWTYALDGRLKKAPRAGAIPRLADHNLDLKPLPVAVFGPFILLNFGLQPTPIEEALADLEQETRDFRLGDMRFIARKTYSLQCNWKVFVDNYLDGGYHVSTMHRDLADSLDLKTYTSRIRGDCVVQSCHARGQAPANSAGTDRIGKRATYLWQFPNMMINRYGPWMDTNWVLPLDAANCRVIFDFYHEGAPDEKSVQENLRDSELVQQEDTTICHRVQAGLQSGAYDQGVYAPKFEAAMYHFHQKLFHELSGAPQARTG